MSRTRTTLAVLLAALVLGGMTFAVAVPATAQMGEESETDDGSIVVVDLSAPESAAPNGTVSVLATLENTGASETTETVEFRVAGLVVDRAYVTLGPGEQATVTLDADTTGLEPGEYVHGVLTESDGAFATLEISESFAVENLSAPANATAGDNITVEATVANPNDVNATQTVTYRFAGGAIESVDLTLGAGETEELSINKSLAGVAEGTYVHGLFTRDSGQLATIDVAAAPNATTEPATVIFSDQSADDSTVVVDSATLLRGGFVTIHDETLLEGNVVGSVVGVSAALGPGSYENISIELQTELDEDTTLIAMPHLDTNGNEVYDFVTSGGAEDGPYLVDGAPVTAAANVTVEAPNGTGPPDGTDAPNGTDDAGEDEPEPAGTTNDESTALTGVPLF